MRGRFRNLVRAKLAGDAAVAVSLSAVRVFSAGGQRLLGEVTQKAIQASVARAGEQLLTAATPRGLQRFLTLPSTEVVGGATRLAAQVLPTSATAEGAVIAGAKSGLTLKKLQPISGAVIRSASRDVLRGASRAAAIGLLIDGGIGAVEGYLAYRRGRLSRTEALLHAGKEAASGALATGTGVMLAGAAVALTGAMGGPAVFVIGAGGAIAAKHVLKRALRIQPLG